MLPPLVSATWTKSMSPPPPYPCHQFFWGFLFCLREQDDSYSFNSSTFPSLHCFIAYSFLGIVVQEIIKRIGANTYSSSLSQASSLKFCPPSLVLFVWREVTSSSYPVTSRLQGIFCQQCYRPELLLALVKLQICRVIFVKKSFGYWPEIRTFCPYSSQIHDTLLCLATIPGSLIWLRFLIGHRH